MAATDTIARIIDEQWPFIQQYCNTFQLRIFDAIRRCRTPALGGHLYRCDSCKKLHYRYNSCRNRHCSRCQNTQKEQWIEQREQQFFNIQGLDDTQELLQKVNVLKWAVYAKPPFGGKEGVVRYLARYTHNVAISHHRIIDYSQGRVTFSYKDYRHAAQKKEMTINAQEFVRRLSMHFLPKGFCRIRHYGILSSAWKQRIFPHAPTPVKINWQDFWKNRGLDVGQCPNCKKGRLICIGKIEPVRGPPYFKTITPLNR